MISASRTITLLGLLMLAAFLSLGFGSGSSADAVTVFRWLVGLKTDMPESLLRAVVVDIRLPRVLLCLLVGVALGSSGAAYQGVFRNPLVSPYILGVSSGAALGAACALSLSLWPTPLYAFVGGVAAVMFTAVLAHDKSGVVMVLAGVIIGGIATSLLTLVQFLSDPFRLQTIVYWTMGNLHHAGWRHILPCAVAVLPAFVVLCLYSWRLNVLALGEEEAAASGLNPKRDKAVIVLAGTIASSAVVAATGIIPMLGLLIPHALRALVGADNRRLVFESGVGAAFFLLLVDTAARASLVIELPIGVFTMLLGSPLLLFLVVRSRLGWEG